MATVGIIAEFNPLHSGHEFLIKEARKSGQLVCVISGNFVQRGDTAIASKEIRAKSALLAGADLVAELPVLWSMSTAQNFALGGVSACIALGCDTLIFGSEEGEIEPLLEIVKILESNEFSVLLNNYLTEGITFASARQRACEELGGKKGILDKPNNNLGIEYIFASRRLGADLTFKTVKRQGAGHDSKEVSDFVSATLLREKLLKGDKDFCSQYMSEEILTLYTQSNLSNVKALEKSILAVLRTKTLEDLKKLPDISEGVENKLFSAIKNATDLDGIYEEMKVKRYPLSRIRRLVLSAFLGFDNTYFMKPLPYVRVLGLGQKGNEIIKTAKETSNIPIVTRVSEIKNTMVFKAESLATDLYNLSLVNPQKCSHEYTLKLITKEL